MMQKTKDPSSNPSSREQTRIAPSSIAMRIREIRGEEKQGDFANRINCNVNTLRSYEKGLANPNFDFIQLICSVENISVDWLIFGRGAMRPSASISESQTPSEHAVIQTKIFDHCPQCAELKVELEEERRERREKDREIRELSAENRKLWKENGELREKCARLEHLDQRSYPATGQAKSA